MIHFLTIGILLGLSAGFAPGPLLTLVISETLQHGIKSGIKVALAPLITDLPVILLTLYLLSKLSGFHSILGIISIAGSLFVLFMAYECIHTKGMEINPEKRKTESLAKGILANAFSPHPYLFWFSIGAPTITRAMDHNISSALAFIAGFYFCLVGSKVTLSIMVGKSGFLLKGKAYLFTMRILGALLVLLAICLFRDGLKLLEII